MTGSLCESFQTLSDETAQRIIAAHDSGMRWSEESNTEHLLLALGTQCPGQIRIAAFSKRREAANGADWEWWFEGPTGAYGMRVQAKRINLRGEVFSHLRHRPRGRALDQMTSLIQAAKEDGLTPAYCFYVASRRQPMSGCFIGHAQAIEQARSTHLRALAPYLFPWHRLVCSGAATGEGDLSETAEMAMSQSVTALATPRGRSAPAAFLGPRQPGLPEHVMDLLDSQMTEHEAPQLLDAEIDAPTRRIRGIVLFRSFGEGTA